MGKENQPATIASSLPAERSSENSKPEPQKETLLTMLLLRLSVHYYRADFGEAQAKSIIRDLVSDLVEFAVIDVEDAIRAYRRDAKSRFFPTSGQLRELAALARKDRAAATQRSALTPEFGEGRPIMWWLQPRRLWGRQWRENEIPAEHRAAFDKAKARHGEA